MTVTGANSSAGPRLAIGEMAVHIILLQTECASGGSSAERPTQDELKEAGKEAGVPRPTDIVVFDHRPWHFAGNQLRSHPKVHDDFPETILQLSISKKQRAVWWSEKRFEITEIKPSADPAHPHHGFPEAATDPVRYPFADPHVTRIEQDVDGLDVFVVRSSVPVDGAKNHMYKISFTMGGDAIDPDMYCTP